MSDHATEHRAEVLGRLENEGRRLTAPRRAIVDLLMQREEGFSVEELLDTLPKVGRATIYRNVKLLVEMGVVCKLALQDGTPRYSVAHAGHHHHAICMRCGTVTDIYRCGVNNLLENVEIATGSQVLGHRLEVYILCPDCGLLEATA